MKNIFQKIRQSFGKKAHTADVEPMLEMSAKTEVKPLSEEQKKAMLQFVFENAKPAPTGIAQVTAGAAILTSRFGPLALRFVISTLVIVLLLGGAWIASPSPVAYGSEKGHTVEIPRNAEMRVVFDRRMDHGSVESAFSIAPPVAGKFKWNDNVLIFTPDMMLEKGMTYEVTVGTNAMNIIGKRLVVPFRQWFKVIDEPEVSVVAPGNNSEIRTNQVLTVIFDHPIRNLTGSLKVPDILTIEPAVKGRYNWLGTSGFEFIPTNGWTPATDFTVTVPQGFEFADGSALENPYTWKFRTADITVWSNVNAIHHRTKEPVVIDFSVPVKASEVLKAMVIKENETVLPTSAFTFLPATGSVSSMKITPRGTFKLGASYSMSLPMGWTGGVGTRGLQNDFVVGFTMDEPGFRIENVCPNDGAEKDLWTGAVITFNNPIETKNLASLVTVTPTLENMEVYGQGWSEYSACGNANDRMLQVSGTWKPSTKYTVTLKPGLRDIYNQVLSGGKSFSFTTKEYPISFELSSYSDQGILASHLRRLYQARVRNMSQPITVTLSQAGGVIAKKEYPTKAALNAYNVIDVDLDEVAGYKLANGEYQVSFYVPEYLYDWNRTIERNVVIADTSLTMKWDNAGKAVIWATDMQTGAVVSDLEIDANGHKAKTDGDGLAVMDVGPKRTFVNDLRVTAKGGGHYGVVGRYWGDGISPWNYNLQSTYSDRLNGYVGTIYTDRKIYRPDQKVMFKGVVRQDRDAEYTVPSLQDVQVIIENPSGQRVFDAKLPMSQYGSFQGELQMESTMKLGDYRIWVTPSGNDAWENRITGYFTVAEFRRPDFKVTVDAPEGPLVQGDALLAKIRAEYYSGAALGGGKATYTVTRRRMDFQPLDGEWFNWSDDENSDCYWYCGSEGNFEQVMSGTKDLNIDGVYALAIPTELGNFKGSAMYNIEVSVEDVNHRFVSNRVEIPVYRGQYALGVRANYDAGWGAPSLDFDVVSVKNDGAMQPNVSGSAKLYRRIWTNTQKENVDGSSTWDSTSTDTLVATSFFTTDNLGRAKVGFSPSEDGEYYVVVSTTDARGNTLSARASRYVYRGYGGSSMRVPDDHTMKIIQNKADYKVGDTASLVVQTPYAATKALLTVERETIREYRVIDLSQTANTIQIPIHEDAVPNIFVSVMTVKGGGEGIPEFRMGYADLRVDTSNKVLDMKITTDKKIYKPGDTVTLTVEANRRGGGPEKAEISVAVVDERIVALLGSVDKNILGAFWFRRTIGVETTQTLTKLVKKVFVSTGMAEGDGKGGGDSSVPIRGNFQDTAYWKADVTTNAQGKATVTFKLPDNLTNWQILAIGATKQTVVGSAEASISTRQMLTVEPLLPRLVRYGDTVKLGASVENGTGVGKTVNMKIEVEGLKVTDGVTRSIWVAPNARVGVTWNIQVPFNGSEARVTVTGKADDASDGYTMKLPIMPFSVAEIVTASDIMEKSATETIEIPENILADESQLRVAVSPNVGQGLASGVDYLLKYEYGCAEQTTSAVVAGTIYEELVSLKLSKGSDAQLQASKDKVNGGIQKVLAMQKPGGGWGYWGDSRDAYPHLTAYVLWGLYQAEQAGFTVDQGAMDRAADYLMYYLSTPSNQTWYWLGSNEKAQVVFVLSEMGKSKLSGYADGLYEQKNSLSVFGKGFLAMAYGNINGRADAKTSQLMKEIENNIVYLDPTAAYVHENEGYGYFMSTDLRSSAITLMAYLRVKPGDENAERLVRWMMRQKSGGYWETTQNTSFALLSLIEYAKKNPIDTAKVDVTVFLDSKIADVLTLAEGDVSPEAAVTYNLGTLLKNGITHQIGLDKDSSKRAFYDISMKVYRQIEDIKPFENGFTVISDYYAKDDHDHVKPIREAKQGEVVRVRMKVIVPKRRQYVAFEHHLPAGLEAIDFQLKTSNQSLNQGGGNYYDDGYVDGKGGGNCTYDLTGYQYCSNPGSWEYDWWWERVWSHTEIRDDRMFLFAEDLYPGMYEYEFFAQAVTQGEFRVPPARAYEMYTPSANGHNEGKKFIVR